MFFSFLLALIFQHLLPFFLEYVLNFIFIRVEILDYFINDVIGQICRRYVFQSMKITLSSGWKQKTWNSFFHFLGSFLQLILKEISLGCLLFIWNRESLFLGFIMSILSRKQIRKLTLNVILLIKVAMRSPNGTHDSAWQAI